jgi:hypothetical protein
LAWVMPRTMENTKEYDVIWIIKDLTITPPANYKIKISSIKNLEIGDNFVIYRSGVLNFYAKVIDNSNSNSGIYYCKIDEGVENYLNSVNPNWTTARNYKMKIQDPINMINGIDDTTHGFMVGIYANQYIKVIYSNKEYIIPMNRKMLDGTWYGVVVNIGNSWGQYNINVWTPTNSMSGDKLSSFYYKTESFTPAEAVVDSYILNRSDAFITNIRLFRSTIEEEKQVEELLSYFSKNADQAIILDNVDSRFSAPYLSRQR